MNAKKVAPLNLSVSRQKLKSPVPQPHCAEVSDAAPRRSVQQNRVFGLRRNPHLAPGTMLLEVHFVGGPEIHRLVGHQRLEFFYAPSAVPGRLGRCWDAACAAESPTAGTAAGTAVPPGQSHIRVQSRPPASCRPTVPAQSHLTRHLAKSCIDPGVASRSGVWAARRVRLRAIRPSHASSNPRTQYSTDRGASPRSSRHLRAGHTLRHQQHPVESMVIAGLL